MDKEIQDKPNVDWYEKYTNVSAQCKLKAEGLVKGASDLVLFVPNKDYHALCLETKIKRVILNADYSHY